ncbi:MAG: TerC family protein [bacterium]
MFDWIFTPEGWTALITLSALEIVLGIDNVLFINILSDNLPKEKRPKARRLGLLSALVMRLLVLTLIAWIMTLKQELFTLFSHGFSGKDLILIGGGLFLIGKSTVEIQENLEGEEESKEENVKGTFISILIQIMLLDAVFSIDSIITAVGLVDTISIIVISMFISMGVMVSLVDEIGRFMKKHPSFKMLGLSFLLMVGMILMSDGFGYHIPRGYVYFAMAYSVFVEILNMNVRKHKEKPAKLRKSPDGVKESKP